MANIKIGIINTPELQDKLQAEEDKYFSKELKESKERKDK